MNESEIHVYSENDEILVKVLVDLNANELFLRYSDGHGTSGEFRVKTGFVVHDTRLNFEVYVYPGMRVVTYQTSSL